MAVKVKHKSKPIKRKLKPKSVKSKLTSDRNEMIETLSSTSNFEEKELKKMSRKELKDLHDSLETEQWNEELEREKENVGMEAGGEVERKLDVNNLIKILESNHSAGITDKKFNSIILRKEDNVLIVEKLPEDQNDDIEIIGEHPIENNIKETVEFITNKYGLLKLPESKKQDGGLIKPEYFTNPSPAIIKEVEEFGIRSIIDNDELTPDGLIYKMEIWNQQEKHGVNPFVYDTAAKLLKKAGREMPSHIRRDPEYREDGGSATIAPEFADGGKTPEIKGIGQFIPVAKIQEIIKFYDNQKDPDYLNEGEDPKQAEGYAWFDTISKFSVLGDSAIVETIISEHQAGKSAMDIHKEIKKLEAGGRIKDIDVKVGNIFELPNGEKIEIKRLFKEKYGASDEDWVEYNRSGSGSQQGKNENSVRELRIFLNNWKAQSMEQGGKPGIYTQGKAESLDQARNALEFRFLQNKIDKDKYEKKLAEMQTYAQKHNIEFEAGGKTKAEKKSLYFPDDKLDYTNQMLIDLNWVAVGGRIEDFYKILKEKSRESAYIEIARQYMENADDVYRALVALDRLEIMDFDTSILYTGWSRYKAKLELFESNVRNNLSKKGEYTHYLMSKPILNWDNYDYANYQALKRKHKFEAGGTTEKNAKVSGETDILKQLIADGFVNSDHSLSNKGKRIADLHKYCFPLGTHPFSYVQYTVEDLYSQPQYVTINDVIYYTDGLLVFELGGHLPDALRESAEQSHKLENQINKTLTNNLTDYVPYAYCPAVLTEDGSVKASEGFIVFHNFINSTEIYVNAFLFNYCIRKYNITSWQADPNGGTLIQAIGDNFTQAILTVNKTAIGVNPTFALFDRDKLMTEIRTQYTDVVLKGKTYKDFIAGWKKENIPANLQKPADIEKTISGFEVLLEIEDDPKEIEKLKAQIKKLRTQL